MKIQKSVIFVNKNLKILIQKIKNVVILETIVIIQENIEVLRMALCSLKYSLPKKLPIDFHNGSNYDYHFILKEVVEEFKKQFTRLGENTEKYITYAALIEKEITRIDKNGEETKNIYLTYCNLLIAQDLWQTHFQIINIGNKLLNLLAKAFRNFFHYQC